MEVINARSALLSNFEVLELLRDLENEHLARTKTAIRIKKEEEASGISSVEKHPATIEITENVRTVQVEAIQYLAAEYQPTSSQTSTGITQLVKDLSSYDLTKAEKLQIVNLAPTQPVELYVIVEELEDRLGDAMESVLSAVSASLSAASSQPVNTSSPLRLTSDTMADLSLQYPSEDFDDGAVVDDMIFDDEGQGVGIEGDLDKEED
ncbi:DNA-directed RNA polymerase III subunit partial [Lentinula edodes]|uniref:DNA-directed RNA polymerase III subunit RPC9 n=1 Tax=Lentinula edodes TaxID=5353 RepID=A0A1Q3EPQ7_LENED|nr:DNA-directed RNA polymerase III subunit partial [Lentinula edodes]